MKIVIVFNHPYQGSYCNAILHAVTKGLKKANHQIDLMHLDSDNFDPVMREKDLASFAKAKYTVAHLFQSLDPQVHDYKKRLEQADHLIFIFPIWWELMPALTKGFIDKVIFPGIAYNYTNNGNRMKPLFKKIKGITIITTMNTPAFLYRIVFGNAVKKAMMTGTFWKMGYRNRKWINLSMVKSVSQNKREKWLVNIEKRFFKL